MIAVVGPGAGAGTDVLVAAERIGRLLAEAGHQVVTGGLGGVMAAAARGARAAGGTAIALLPGDDATVANEDSGVVVATGLGQGRNVLIVRGADAVIAVGGSWGTLNEVALARRLDKPVVWMAGWQVHGPDGAPIDEEIPVAASAEEAVAYVLARLSADSQSYKAEDPH